MKSELLSSIGVEHGFDLRDDDEALWRARQVHGTTLAERPGPGDEADALFTRRPGHAVAVATADCVPLLLACPAGVAAVHAGWRGTAAGIAGLAVERLCGELGAGPADWRVAIGPHIGPCCYEVDEPVRAAVGEGPHLAAGRPGHWQLDLFELNRAQLLAAGVLASRIERVGGCTLCAPERHPSHRRDQSGERMLHWIRMGP
jgi:YfiH family protein